MFGNSVSTMNFSFLEGVTESHHEASHHQNKSEKLDQYQKISTWHVAQLTYLLGKLKSTGRGLERPRQQCNSVRVGAAGRQQAQSA
jgi:hypothetical protein